MLLLAWRGEGDSRGAPWLTFEGREARKVEALEVSIKIFIASFIKNFPCSLRKIAK